LARWLNNRPAPTTAQDTIEGRLEKRTKGVFAPAGGKKLVRLRAQSFCTLHMFKRASALGV